MITTIYGLYDPSQPEVIQYVGRADSPQARCSQHVNNALKNRKVNRFLMNWIRSLLTRGARPAVRILEVVPVAEWERHEILWIAAMRAVNPDLLNIADGGNGDPGLGQQKAVGNRPEVKEQRSKTTRGMWQNPEYVARRKCKRIPAEFHLLSMLRGVLKETATGKEFKDRRYAAMLAWRRPRKTGRIVI